MDTHNDNSARGNLFDESGEPNMVSLDVIVDVEVIFWRASKKGKKRSVESRVVVGLLGNTVRKRALPELIPGSL